jgi:hypothetical protein
MFCMCELANTTEYGQVENEVNEEEGSGVCRLGEAGHLFGMPYPQRKRKSNTKSTGYKSWCGWRGSNPRPLASEANTLSTELQPHVWGL